MHLDDPFPIERCSPRLRNAILAEVRWRSPTLEELISIPSKQWLKVPGIGQALLLELEAIMQSELDQTMGHAPVQMTDAELIARLERLQRDLKRFRHDLLTRINDPQPRAGSLDSTDLH